VHFASFELSATRHARASSPSTRAAAHHLLPVCVSLSPPPPFPLRRRWLTFDGAAFVLKWAADSSSAPKGTFPLDPNDLTTGVCDDHRKSFEIKISSGGKTLYFCCESADAQNTLLARIDAGRRLQVASVEIGPTGAAFYKTENAVVSAGNGLMLGEPGKKVFSWGVGTLLGIGAPNISGMAVPQRIPAFRAR
jgi:hypothetical protein